MVAPFCLFIRFSGDFMKNSFFEKLNMMIVNIIFSLVLTVGFSYYFLMQKMYVAFSIILAAFMVFAAINIIVYFLKKKLHTLDIPFFI